MAVAAVIFHKEVFVDAIVVGSGLCGITAAQQLSQAGKRCLILEAGPRLKEIAGQNLAMDDALWGYASEGVPFHWDRVRAAGGRSLVWGGWCADPEEQNWRDAEQFGTPWPFAFAELTPFVQQARVLLKPRLLEIPPHYKLLEDELGLAVEPKAAALVDAKRALSALDLLGNMTLRPECLVCELLVSPDGRIGGVGYVDLKTGARKEATAPFVFLAASPIENARLLLESPQLKDKIPLQHVGRGLTDHLVGSYLLVNPPVVVADTAPVAAAAAWVRRFVNLGEHNQRDYLGGFVVEVSGPSSLQHIDAEILAKLDIEKFDVKNSKSYMIHVIGEAVPSSGRYVSLHESRRDRFGRALPVIHWDEQANDQKMAAEMFETARSIAEVFGADGSELICFHEPHLPGGVAHEAGTCKMGISADVAVTDSFGGVFGMDGLYVVDASLMPTALDRYPTVTALALTLRTTQAALRRGRSTAAPI